LANSCDREAQLTQAAIGGDATALKLLLLGTQDRLVACVSRRIPADLRTSVDAEDVIQETHIEVFRRIELFVPAGRDSFFRWMATIAMNRLRTAIRRHRAVKRGGGRTCEGSNRHLEGSTLDLLDMLAGPGRSPSRCFTRDEAVRIVQSEIAELPPQYRQAIWLVHIEGETARTAAVNMGRTERAVHGLCARGLKLLRERLEGRTMLLDSTV